MWEGPDCCGLCAPWLVVLGVIKMQAEQVSKQQTLGPLLLFLSPDSCPESLPWLPQ